jgi:cAMP-dependent protein kinase regulator
VTSNILFQSLDKEQLRVVVAAMEKQTFVKDDWIIRQGDEGHEFYIVASGTCETFIRIGEEDKMVKVYTHGEAFGELALMYNTPRKASIQASSDDVRLWAMDRQTFRRVLMESTCEKRGRYETFLARVPVLQTLDNYERSKVADALVERDFAAGEHIITMGDTSDTSFYILLEGAAAATKTLAGDSSPVTVMEYKPGDYFGELALLSAAPRAANVVAVSACKVVYLDREAFERLLGPCQEVLQRDQAKYKAVEARLQTVNKNN